jgi:4-diphosphocytidyl-2-C-methyl-D-erythritol kinase
LLLKGKQLVLHSYAKLNLYLEVLNKRPDNYHNIKTVFERINLYDTIVLKKRQDQKINLICRVPGIPKDSTQNIAYRTAKLLKDSLNIHQGVDIKIIKRIPVAAGLAGGSSNAAAVFTGLNKLWKLNLAQKKLLSFAKIIGADVPFFLYNCSFAYARARGDKIKPLHFANNLKLWHVLVVPYKKIITAKVYNKWDSLRIKLTRPQYDAKILTLALKKKDFPLLTKALFNSLEVSTGKLYPEIRLIKKMLFSLDLKAICMSGSGPAVFGIVSSKKEGLSLCRQLNVRMRRKRKSWQVFVIKTR